MGYGLNILPNGTLDFLSLGALVHRLDSGVVPFRKATECQIHVSGGERKAESYMWGYIHTSELPTH